MAQFFGLIPLNADNFESGSASEGQVLSADGSGGASWETVEGGSGTPLVDVTYAQLVTLIGASGLTAGQQYRITDFATTHYIVDGGGTQYTTGDGVIVGVTEPLIITAVDVNKLDMVAKSATYPQDIIYYDWNPDNWLHDLSFAVDGTTIITGWKGVIISRYDTIKEIQAPSDWRNCVTRRWETAAPAWDAETTYAAGDIISHAFTVDEETISMVYKSLVGTNVGNEPAGETDAYWIVLLNLSTFTYWNASSSSWNGIPSAVTYYDFKLFQDFEYSYQIHITTYIPSLLINSIFVGEATSNTIGSSFYYNTIGGGFYSNTIGDGFSSNTTGGFSSNTIGNNFSSNTIGDFSFNTIGNNFSFNTSGYSFTSNTIGDDFYSNTIGDGFYSNTIGDGFSQTDYTSATHVYGYYDCTLFKRLDGTPKLRYFDNNDVQQVVAVTA